MRRRPPYLLLFGLNCALLLAGSADFLASRAEGAPAGRAIGRDARSGLRATTEVVPVHDAVPTAAQPQGWSYPYACCSGIDCREIADQAIGEGPAGYVIKGTGELVAYGDSRIKDSPDGVFHWCSVAGADDSRTICLFVPPRGF